MNRSMPLVLRRLGTFGLMALASAAIAAPQSRPFKAKLTVTESIQFTGAAPCFAIGSIQAIGTATHLGKVTVSSHDCINPQGVFDPSAPNSFSFASTGAGSTGLVFTAANGDSLFAAHSGTLTAQSSGPHRITGQFIITGGTGRFVGATGGGTMTGYEDISQIVSGHGEIDVAGVIVY